MQVNDYPEQPCHCQAEISQTKHEEQAPPALARVAKEDEADDNEHTADNGQAARDLEKRARGVTGERCGAIKPIHSPRSSAALCRP